MGSCQRAAKHNTTVFLRSIDPGQKSSEAAGGAQLQWIVPKTVSHICVLSSFGQPWNSVWLERSFCRETTSMRNGSFVEKYLESIVKKCGNVGKLRDKITPACYLVTSDFQGAQCAWSEPSECETALSLRYTLMLSVANAAWCWMCTFCWLASRNLMSVTNRCLHAPRYAASVTLDVRR